MARILCAVVLVALVGWSHGQGPPAAGPPASGDDDGGECTLNMQTDIDECDTDQEFVDTSDLEVVRVNETFAYLAGIFQFIEGWDDTFFLYLMVYKEQAGHEQMIFSYPVCEICKEVDDPDSDHYMYLRAFGFPDNCPFVAGSYTVDKMEADASDLPITDCGNRGRYVAKAMIYKDKAPGKHCDQSVADFKACLSMKFFVEKVNSE